MLAVEGKAITVLHLPEPSTLQMLNHKLSNVKVAEELPAFRGAKYWQMAFGLAAFLSLAFALLGIGSSDLPSVQFRV